MCSLFTACLFAVVSAPLPSPSAPSYCLEDILQLAVESEEANAEGSQHGQVIVVVIAATLALATSAVTVAATMATVAAVAVTAAGMGVPIIGKAADHLVTFRLSWFPLVCIDVVVIVVVTVILWLVPVRAWVVIVIARASRVHTTVGIVTVSIMFSSPDKF